MYPSSKSNAVTVEELGLGAAIRSAGTPVDDLRVRFAGNDDTCADAAPSTWPLSYALYQGARARRAGTLRALLATARRAIRAWVRRARARYRQHRDAEAIRDALAHLDARSLHDLGFDRSEIGSVAAEASGRIESTRIRTHHMLCLR